MESPSPSPAVIAPQARVTSACSVGVATHSGVIPASQRMQRVFRASRAVTWMQLFATPRHKPQCFARTDDPKCPLLHHKVARHRLQLVTGQSGSADLSALTTPAGENHRHSRQSDKAQIQNLGQSMALGPIMNMPRQPKEAQATPPAQLGFCQLALAFASSHDELLHLLQIILGMSTALVSAALGFSSAFWTSYCIFLQTHPVQTKLATALIGCFLGDLIAQGINHAMAVQNRQEQLQQKFTYHNPGGDAAALPAVRFKYNVAHVARLLLFCAVTAPIGQYWYSVLDTLVLPHTPAAPQAVLTKVALDQLCMTPVMTSLFFAAMRAMEDLSSGLQARRFTLAQLLHRAQAAAASKLFPTLAANYLLWPAAHVVNFAFVPSEQRILYITVVSMVWTAFLSWQAQHSTSPSMDAGAASGPDAQAGGMNPGSNFQQDQPPDSPGTVRSS